VLELAVAVLLLHVVWQGWLHVVVKRLLVHVGTCGWFLVRECLLFHRLGFGFGFRLHGNLFDRLCNLRFNLLNFRFFLCLKRLFNLRLVVEIIMLSGPTAPPLVEVEVGGRPLRRVWDAARAEGVGFLLGLGCCTAPVS